MTEYRCKVTAVSNQYCTIRVEAENKQKAEEKIRSLYPRNIEIKNIDIKEA